MRGAWFSGVCLLWLLCPALLPAQQTRVRTWTQAALVDAAAIHASRLPSKQRYTVRYIDLHNVPYPERVLALRVLGYAVNSLSHYDRIVLPQTVPGTQRALAWIDLATLRGRNDEVGLKKFIRAFERLGEKGSGPSAFPEPYYHGVVIKYDVVDGRQVAYTERVRERDANGRGYLVYNATKQKWEPSYVTVTKYRTEGSRKVRRFESVLGPWLNRATAVGLAATLDTNQPIFEYYWFLANALVEPRYHELLGLNNSINSVKRLVFLDEKTADKAGSQLRGAVLFSEVAHRVRVLERTPTQFRAGRGSFQRSIDFKTSINFLREQDPLKNLLIDDGDADANETIFSLPNGLLGFYVNDNKGRRLDKADGDIANDLRLKFRDTQVRTAYHCIGCHLPAHGWIEVDDEVRELAKKPVTLLADAFSKKDKTRGERIRQKYLEIDYNELLQADQAVVKVAVRAATARPGDPRGLTGPETARYLINAIWRYLEQPVSLEQLATELGYSRARVILAARVAGLDHPFVGLLAGRKQRRDQIESAFGQIATILYTKSYLNGE
jgi:hypothetical protein